MDDFELSKLIEQATSSRGGKPAKYLHLAKHEEIVKLIENDVSLPFILNWLIEKKGEKLVLRTLRKYVVFKIGRPAYEKYLKRNGWFKTKESAPKAFNKKNETEMSPLPNKGLATKEEQGNRVDPGPGKISESDLKKLARNPIDLSEYE